MLTQDQKKEIELAIRNKIEELAVKIEEYKELTRPIPPENAIGRVSRMDAINNKSVNEAALRTAESSMQKLKFALEKIDEDYFGLCKGCGEPIPLGRMLLMPGSIKCVACAG